jgi:cell division protein FtsQ
MKAGRKTKKDPGRSKKLGMVAARLKYFVMIAIPVAAVIGSIYSLSHATHSVFRLKAVTLTGNKHLTDGELLQMSGLRGDEGMISLSARKVYEKLRESPWIRTVSVRKEFPSGVQILIREAEPFALLDMKGKLFIVDDRGQLLEELRDNSVPFLPVIFSNPYREKEAFYEAVSLAKAVKEMGMLQKSDRIEIIAHKANDISVTLDGMIVKVGAGDYEDKLARLLEIEEEVKARNIPVDYIDLRFARKVIVKPVNEVIR